MLSFFPEDVALRQQADPLFDVDRLQTLFRLPQGRQLRPDPGALRADVRRLLNHPPVSLRNESDLGCMAVAVFFLNPGEKVCLDSAPLPPWCCSVP